MFFLALGLNLVCILQAQHVSSDWPCYVPKSHMGSWPLDWTRQPTGLHAPPPPPPGLSPMMCSVVHSWSSEAVAATTKGNILG